MFTCRIMEESVKRNLLDSLGEGRGYKMSESSGTLLGLTTRARSLHSVALSSQPQKLHRRLVISPNYTGRRKFTLEYLLRSTRSIVLF